MICFDRYSSADSTRHLTVKAHPVREAQTVKGNTSAAVRKPARKFFSFFVFCGKFSLSALTFYFCSLSTTSYSWLYPNSLVTLSLENRANEVHAAKSTKEPKFFWGQFSHFQLVNGRIDFIYRHMNYEVLRNKQEPPWGLASIQINNNGSLVPVNKDC